jgi:predicted nucleic acid-binding protein
MKVYADTSVLVAWFHPQDEFAPAVTDWCRERPLEFFWNALLRAELRHNLRRLRGSYAATAWQAYRASEGTGRLRLTSHRLADIAEWADDVSARFSGQTSAGTWDCAHVAIAQHLRAEAFITCDSAQAELARLAGLRGVHLFE